MANRRKDSLRERIREIRKEEPHLTYKEIALKVKLKDRQWVYYYLKDERKNKAR